MQIVGLLFLIAVDLFACVAATFLAFRAIQKIETLILKDSADPKPGLSVLLGQAAVGLTIMTISVSMIAGFEVESLLNSGRGERAPIHSIIGREGVGFFRAASTIALLGLPLAMLGSVMLGSCGAIGGMRSKNRRAILYGLASLAINGLIVLLFCWIFGSIVFRGNSESEEPDNQTGAVTVPIRSGRNSSGVMSGKLHHPPERTNRQLASR